jgi:hypothetical protein
MKKNMGFGIIKDIAYTCDLSRVLNSVKADILQGICKSLFSFESYGWQFYE